MEKQPIDRHWSAYPIGTIAHAHTGGTWVKTKRGWKWGDSATFTRPSADAYAVTLPEKEEDK